MQKWAQAQGPKESGGPWSYFRCMWQDAKWLQKKIITIKIENRNKTINSRKDIQNENLKKKETSKKAV